jgi:YHS domain-containing protein
MKKRLVSLYSIALLVIPALASAQSSQPTSAPTSLPTSQPSDESAEAASCGCGGCEAGFACDMRTPTEEEAAAAVAQPGAEIGDSVVCPVSAQLFTVSPLSIAVEYEGNTYYVCCPPCRDAWNDNPAQFVVR